MNNTINEEVIDFTLPCPIPQGNLEVTPKDFRIECGCGGTEARIVGNGKWYRKYCLACGEEIQYHVNLPQVKYYGKR